jgi:hypothetical protein
MGDTGTRQFRPARLIHNAHMVHTRITTAAAGGARGGATATVPSMPAMAAPLAGRRTRVPLGKDTLQSVTAVLFLRDGVTVATGGASDGYSPSRVHVCMCLCGWPCGPDQGFARAPKQDGQAVGSARLARPLAQSAPKPRRNLPRPPPTPRSWSARPFSLLFLSVCVSVCLCVCVCMVTPPCVCFSADVVGGWVGGCGYDRDCLNGVGPEWGAAVGGSD